MSKTKHSATPKTVYTSTQAASDFGKLLPYLHGEFISLGALSKCCGCAKDVLENTGSSIAFFNSSMTGDESVDIYAICEVCVQNVNQNKEKILKIKGIQIPASDDERLKFIANCRSCAIEKFAKNAGYPLVSKPLLMDDPNHIAILFTGEKAFNTFVHWNDSDPWIVGGRLAKDGLAVYKSMNAGKTKVCFMLGNAFIHTSDKELVQQLSREG